MSTRPSDHIDDIDVLYDLQKAVALMVLCADDYETDGDVAKALTLHTSASRIKGVMEHIRALRRQRVQGPDGYATWRDAAVAARAKVARLEWEIARLREEAK